MAADKKSRLEQTVANLQARGRGLFAGRSGRRVESLWVNFA